MEHEWFYTWWKYNPKYKTWHEYDWTDTPRGTHRKPAKKKWNPKFEKEMAQIIKEREIANMDMSRKPME